ncbi:MAG: EamA/RhaT family transporter, partial [Muribaculaceae bacterium]|nr:EamA/RhaT family transporter [Muribaculaceae bacterium]
LYAGVILIVASVVSYATGQDHFSWWQILSMVLIVLSLWLVEFEERKDTPAPSTTQPAKH